MRFDRPGIFAVTAAMLCGYHAPLVCANDECEDAILIEPNSETEFDTAGATPSSQEYLPAQCIGTYFTATGPDIWFVLNFQSAGKLLLTTCHPGSFDTDLSLYTGECSLMTQVACNGDAGDMPACQPYFSRIIYDVLSPGTYYVRIGGYNGDIGMGELTSVWQPIEDCDGDGIPDTEEPDCDLDGWPDDCEEDCDSNGIPDDCEAWEDCNENSVPDQCDLLIGHSSDFNINGILDDCEANSIELPFTLSGLGGVCLPEGPISAPMSGMLIGAHVQFNFDNTGDQTWASDLMLCIECLEDATVQIGGYNILCTPTPTALLTFPEKWQTTRVGDYECYIPLNSLNMSADGEYVMNICHGYEEGDEVASWSGSIKFLYLEMAAPCPGDINNDQNIDGADMGLLIASWGSCPDCPADLNGDGQVNGADVGQFLASWGPCP